MPSASRTYMEGYMLLKKNHKFIRLLFLSPLLLFRFGTRLSLLSSFCTALHSSATNTTFQVHGYLFGDLTYKFISMCIFLCKLLNCRLLVCIYLGVSSVGLKSRGARNFFSIQIQSFILRKLGYSKVVLYIYI